MNYSNQLNQAAPQQTQGAYSGNALGGTARMSEVEGQVGSLYAAVERLTVNAETLIKRITPVISISGAAVGKDQADAPDVALCPHADNLRSLTKRIDRLASLLDETYHAVEL